MKISPDLADRLYSIMVMTIGSPDDYHRRWSFTYAMTVGEVAEYAIDSRLGPGARFRNKWKTVPPVIVCASDQITPLRQTMLAKANSAIAQAMRPVRTRRRPELALAEV